MKKIILSFFAIVSLLSTNKLFAQAFYTQADPSDTIYATVDSAASIFNKITDSASGGLSVKWHVTATDFPADWLTYIAFGICDNKSCYYNSDSSLWNVTTHSGGASNISNTYLPAVWGDFHLVLNLTGVASTGTHYLTVSIQTNVTSGPAPSKSITFIINRSSLSVPIVNNAPTPVSLYPNPANNEINVIYDASADVKTIAVYNIIGKVMAVYKVGDNSANLNIENIPSGMYFARLINSHGEVVVTRKFSKQ